MARALQDDGRRRAEPTAAVSGGPAFPVGGTVALPPSLCRSPLALSPGLNGVYRCRRGQELPRRRSSSAHGALQPSAAAPLVGEEGGAPPAEAGQGLAQPNGHLSALPPANLEQAIGACLRRLGDQFQRDYELRDPRPPRVALWGHLYQFVFHLLGILYNRPVRG
ncbi:hypothetical protein JRQ81_011374 [Phrynocephalus forsythii]|uniref:Uncharacterized protein n=1 Tax=Phrynocephalus forsythii TaxID=171643 RepID=A0A9Q1AQG2_9SAUR|nr:hypothetical protein JRQ81_011374 [Phrynocephalus forsythii]